MRDRPWKVNRSFWSGMEARRLGRAFESSRCANKTNTFDWQVGWLYADAQLPPIKKYKSYYDNRRNA